MKRPDRDRPAQQPAAPARAPRDARTIDERYGLEPVFEPDGDTGAGDGGGGGGTEPYTIECPYCGEPFEILLDLSAGSANYIEDCSVCCQPIEFDVEIDPAGQLVSLTATRGD